MIVMSEFYMMPVAPGATIKEQLDMRQMTQKEFSVRMGYSEKHISNLINGKVELTFDMANRLESVLGLPAVFWSNLESQYRSDLLKSSKDEAMKQDLASLKHIPYNEMSKLGWIEDTRSRNDRVINLRKYFGVAYLDLIFAEGLKPVVFRQLCERKDGDYALMCWLQQLDIKAKEVETEKFDANKLKDNIPYIRSMTCEKPEEFMPKLNEVFKSCGIAFVVLPNLKGSYLQGATYKDKNKVVLGLAIRGKYTDMFWFGLFHELGLIVLGHIDANTLDEQAEIEADSYASRVLIPKDSYSKFLDGRLFTKESIIEFASSINVAPGIVVGRLQTDEKIKFSEFNDLKIKYELN